MCLRAKGERATEKAAISSLPRFWSSDDGYAIHGAPAWTISSGQGRCYLPPPVENDASHRNSRLRPSRSFDEGPSSVGHRPFRCDGTVGRCQIPLTHTVHVATLSVCETETCRSIGFSPRCWTVGEGECGDLTRQGATPYGGSVPLTSYENKSTGESTFERRRALPDVDLHHFSEPAARHALWT